jgi:site-specific DNA-methyltransferase (adenine-specific)
MLDTLERAWSEANGGESIWANPNLRFLDPFTKSGVFLRQIAIRLIDGLEQDLPDLQSRVDHILTEQLFGLATTHLTSLISRRSLYCSKSANGKHSVTKKFDSEAGNIWFEPQRHAWKSGKVRQLTMDDDGNEVERFLDGRCLHCGASKRDFDREEGLELHAYGLIHTEDSKKWVGEIFGEDMKFDVIIGNPPYQLKDGGGGSSASPIYQKFFEKALALEPKYLSMVIKANWFSGGKGLDEFRATMLNSNKISHLVDFADSRQAFDGVDVAGGICYFLWDSGGVHEVCEITSHGTSGAKTESRALNEYPVFVRDNIAADIIRKVKSKATLFLDTVVSSRRPFDLDSNFPGSPSGELKLYKAGGDSFTERSQVRKGNELVDAWKVLLSKTSSEHAGQADKSGQKRVLSRLEIMPPGSVATESYLILGPFKTEVEAGRMHEYLSTRFSRYLLSSILLTQNISKSSFAFVPQVDMSRGISDEDLFELFELTQEERDEILRTIKGL